MKNFLLYLSTPFMRAYKAWDVWYTKRQYEKRWALEYQTELNALDQTDKANAWYAPIVKNQMNHLRMCDATQGMTSSPNVDTFLLFRVGCAAARRFGVLNEIVGVQPLISPTGLVYQLAYNYQSEEGKMRLEVKKHAVEAGSRKLQARWTLEAAQDLAAFGVDFEEELIAVLGDQIAHEVVAEVIRDLLTLAKQNEGDVEVYTAKKGSVAINRVCNQIAQATRRGAGNFVIGSPIFVASLQMDKSSTFAKVEASANPTHALSYVGILNGTTKVYSSPHVGDDIIVGYKGVGAVDTGYIYSPYVPVMTTGVVIDPNTFAPLLGFMTRYGKFAGPRGEVSYGSGHNYYRALSFPSDPAVLLEFDLPENPEVDQTVDVK